MSDYKKPLPRIDEESRGYWEALGRHELYFQRCRDCGTKRFPPRDRKSTRLNSSHIQKSRMPSSA